MPGTSTANSPWCPVAAVAAGLGALAPAGAASHEPNGVEPETITVVATGVSTMDAASAGDVSQKQIAREPLLRPAALLENVPGLIVTQHSGEGKANQYFMRAFNLDHGTDLAIAVDDMPVNMPTHAHGQGYADLNFLLPELTGDLHYKKGTYYCDEGDFATAGAARISLVNALPNFASLGGGADGYARALLGASAALGGGTLLGAGEIYRNNGPFDVADDYRRLNGTLRYYRGDDRDYWSATAMAYSGRWTATDQVPAGAVADGTIDRFGSLNPSDGGSTDRYSLSFNRVIRTAAGQDQLSAYVIRYRLDLWSTFTYYLRDPLHGDQILQHDDRVVYGAKASRSWFADLAGLPATNVIGVQLRRDDIRDVGIFPTAQRQVVGTTQDAAVTESSGALYFENGVQWGRRLRSVLGLRADVFNFDVRDRMVAAGGSCTIASDPLGCDTGRRSAAIMSPKLGVILGPWQQTTYFVNVGAGYHSNDARGVTRSGENPGAAPVTPLARASGAELGLASRVTPRWDTSADVFLLHLASELAIDGDSGTTSPRGASTRLGIEWSNSYRLTGWLAADLNATVTQARYDHNSAADDLGCATAAASHPCPAPIAIVGRHIPNSPTGVVGAALSAHSPGGWFGSLRARHFGEAPLVEDNSTRSAAYTTLDLQLGYEPSRRWLVALELFNVANHRWDDIEYYYVSRLRNQAFPAADYVIHPGVPRTLRARLQYRF